MLHSHCYLISTDQLAVACITSDAKTSEDWCPPTDFRISQDSENDQTQIPQQFDAQLLPKMPLNFSWVVDGLLAALGFPTEPGNILYLINQGIRYLISLTAEQTPSLGNFNDQILWSQIKIEDFTPPTIEQVEQFLAVLDVAIKERAAVAIHCAHGKGRTGTMIACFLVKHYKRTATQAIADVRGLRPGSVETESQEQLVKAFEKYIRPQ